MHVPEHERVYAARSAVAYSVVTHNVVSSMKPIHTSAHTHISPTIHTRVLRYLSAAPAIPGLPVGFLAPANASLF